MTEVFNLLDVELHAQPPGHAREGHTFSERGLGKEVGAKAASWSVYELAPGQRGGAYHYELNREEWVLVIEGELTVRGPDGERVLRAGDVACFALGPEGAHAFRNDSSTAARYAMLSTVEAAFAIIYPDSARIAVVGEGFKRKLQLAEDRPYWEGEP